MPKFDPEKPVSKAAVEFLRDQIKDSVFNNSEAGGYFIYKHENKLSKGKEILFNYVNHVLSSDWFLEDKLMTVAVDPTLGLPKAHSYGTETLKSTNSVVNTCCYYVFGEAGRDFFTAVLHFKLIKDIATNELKCQLSWEPYQQEKLQVPDPGHLGQAPFKRIIVVNKLWDTEYTTSFDRGLHAQADELGIKIDDRRTYQSMGDILEIRHILNPSEDSMMVFFGNNLKMKSDIKTLIEDFDFHVVTTAGESGFIRQDSTSLGRRLAKQCLADDLNLYPDAVGLHARYVLVVDFDQADAHEVRLRKKGIDTEFNTYIDKNRLIKEDVKLICKPPYNERVKETIAAIQQAIARLGPENIAAIFPRTERATLATVSLMNEQENREKYKHIRVYGEWLASTHLAVLKDEASPLYACCCTDPYYFARYTVRAASCRWSQPLPEIMPILITKEKAIIHSINSAARIPEFFDDEDVRLNDSKYGWSEWMRSRCAGTYGPSRLRR